MLPGKALIIDLSSGKSRIEEISSDTLQHYLGGRGLAARLMWDWAKPPLNPLGPENRLIFSVGPIQGTGITYETKTIVSTVSPLTDLYLFSVSGGQVGPTL
ncbi:MAG: aldehyde ferredoxin oxidoreductase N-terminal domain-containing protein, partial [Thermodesulfobacteriota bacterium]